MTTSAVDPEIAAQKQCTALASQMAELRQFHRPPAGAPPVEVYEALIDVRGRLDQAEELLTESARFKAGMRSRARKLDGDADDAFASVMARLGKQSMRREFEGVQDRVSQARLETLEQRRQARIAMRIADIAEDCYDRVRTMYFSLRDVRGELVESLRYLEWESHLER
jgi:hypothetical protein